MIQLMSDSKENVQTKTHGHDDGSVYRQCEGESTQMVMFDVLEIPSPLASPTPRASVAAGAGIASDAHTTANTSCALSQCSGLLNI